MHKMLESTGFVMDACDLCCVCSWWVMRWTGIISFFILSVCVCVCVCVCVYDHAQRNTFHEQTDGLHMQSAAEKHFVCVCGKCGKPSWLGFATG